MSSQYLIEEGLGPVRDAIFNLSEPVCWTKEQFDRLWPYCDNIWSFRKRLTTSRVLYRCRLERATRPKPKQEGVKHRNRPLREKRCSAHMVMETLEDGTVKIRRRGETMHAHGLAAVDKVKINTALKKIEKDELQKGYSPQAVWAALTFHKDGEGQKILEEAGGRHLDSAHVYNQSLLLKKAPKATTAMSDIDAAQERQAFDQDLNDQLGQQDDDNVLSDMHEHAVDVPDIENMHSDPMMMRSHLED